MRVTEEELIDIWKYFQYCCFPSIIVAKYAFFDYIEDIKKESKFYRFNVKHDINEIGKYLDSLPNKLMDISPQYKRYMTIFSSNIEEIFEEDEDELHRAIYITLRNGKLQHLECLTAIHYISALLQISSIIFSKCCNDLMKLWGKDPTKSFGIYNLQEVVDKWNTIADKASKLWEYDKLDKKHPIIDLNNPRCIKAISNISNKLTSIETLRIAMEKSYPWSPNYKEGLPYEQSDDYLIVNSNSKTIKQ